MSVKAAAFAYPYPRPALTVDAAIVAKNTDGFPKLLLIQRKHDPFAGSWALPGGFVNELEPLDTAVARELQEETSIDPSKIVSLKQIGCFGDPGRDPRGWTVTVAYAGLVPSSTELPVLGADDAAEARWFDVGSLPELAFDHRIIVRSALEHLIKEDSKGGAGTRAALVAAAEQLE